MNCKTKKSLLLSLLIVCLLFLAALPTISSALANEQVEESGKLPGGHSARIEIELNEGEVIQGTILIWNASTIGGARFYFEDAVGNIVRDFGRVSERNFEFAPQSPGRYTAVIKNPNPVVSSGYTLTYNIISSPGAALPLELPIDIDIQPSDVSVGEEAVLILSARNPTTCFGTLILELTLPVPPPS